MRERERATNGEGERCKEINKQGGRKGGRESKMEYLSSLILPIFSIKKRIHFLCFTSFNLSIFTTEDIRERRGREMVGKREGENFPQVSDEPSRPRTSVQPTAFEAATLASTISKSTTPTPPPTSLSTTMWLLLLLQLLLLRSGLWPWPLSNKTVSEGEREKLRAPE